MHRTYLSKALATKYLVWRSFWFLLSLSLNHVYPSSHFHSKKVNLVKPLDITGQFSISINVPTIVDIFSSITPKNGPHDDSVGILLCAVLWILWLPGYTQVLI